MSRLEKFNDGQTILEDINEAATFFLEKMLGIDPNSALYRNPGYILEKSYNSNFSTWNPMKDLEKELDSQAIPEERRNILKTKFARVMAYFHQQGGDTSSLVGAANNTGTDVVGIESTTADSNEVSVSSKWLVLGYTPKVKADFARTMGKKETTPQQKLQLCKELFEEVSRMGAVALTTSTGHFASKENELWAQWKLGKKLATSSRNIFKKYMNAFAFCFAKCNAGCAHDFQLGLVLDINGNKMFEPTEYSGCMDCKDIQE